MNKEELKVIEKLKWYYKDSQNLDVAICTNVVLNLIQKQEAIINKMAEQLTTPVHSKEWIIEFYKKEVENGDREKH